MERFSHHEGVATVRIGPDLVFSRLRERLDFQAEVQEQLRRVARE